MKGKEQERISYKDYREKPEKKNKYNARKVTVDGITFPSQAEAKYYMNLKWLQMHGDVKEFELQPSFIVQDNYIKDGKKVRAMKYTPDFKVTDKNGNVEYVEIKGKMTEAARMRIKMFNKRYPDLTLIILKFVNGRGFVDFRDLKKYK